MRNWHRGHGRPKGKPRLNAIEHGEGNAGAARGLPGRNIEVFHFGQFLWLYPCVSND